MPGRDAAAHRVQCADSYLVQVCQVALQHVHQQLTMRFRGERPAIVGLAQSGQCGVDAEAYPLVGEKIEHLPRRVRVGCEGADAANVHAMRAGALDAGHRARKITLAAVGVIDLLRAVEAGAD